MNIEKHYGKSLENCTNSSSTDTKTVHFILELSRDLNMSDTSAKGEAVSKSGILKLDLGFVLGQISECDGEFQFEEVIHCVDYKNFEVESWEFGDFDVVYGQCFGLGAGDNEAFVGQKEMRKKRQN
ncbi:hypothetical protein ABFX02_07G049700 [Erythranthe guttata]